MTARDDDPVLATAVVVGVAAGIVRMVGCFVLMAVCLDLDDPHPPPLAPDLLARIGVYGAFAFGIAAGLPVVAVERRGRGRGDTRSRR